MGQTLTIVKWENPHDKFMVLLKRCLKYSLNLPIIKDKYLIPIYKLQKKRKKSKLSTFSTFVGHLQNFTFFKRTTIDSIFKLCMITGRELSKDLH